ncbi:MAG: hypothetical protein HZA13_07370 [Nitrospirae bacterium]|nr:hypothetical protein [Nitrospirota bacterium]
MGARAVQWLLRYPHTPRLHRQSRMLASALPMEGATQAPANESRSQESEVRSQEKSLDSESSKQRADASVEGEAPSGFAGGGGDASPYKLV